jgi:hypothetical protein
LSVRSARPLTSWACRRLGSAHALVAARSRLPITKGGRLAGGQRLHRAAEAPCLRSGPPGARACDGGASSKFKWTERAGARMPMSWALALAISRCRAEPSPSQVSVKAEGRSAGGQPMARGSRALGWQQMLFGEFGAMHPTRRQAAPGGLAFRGPGGLGHGLTFGCEFSEFDRGRHCGALPVSVVPQRRGRR